MTIVMKRAPSKPSMSMEEFKRWLKQFDHNGDGVISKRELHVAMRSASVRLSWLRSGEGMRDGDLNGDGVLDEKEMENLITFAHKRLGMTITNP